VVARRRGGRI